MPSLLSLANETIYQILDQILPDDVLNFALSCKRIHLLSQDTLEQHLDRRARYTNVVLHGCYRHDHDGHPLRLIRDICLDWRVALYTKTMSIHYCNLREDEREDESAIIAVDDETEKQRKCLKREDNITIRNILGDFYEDIGELVTRCEQLLGLSMYESRSIYADIEKGYRGPMLGLLLVLLPNLEALAHERYSDTASRSYIPFALHIASASRDENWPSKPLAKLVEVEVYRGNSPEVVEDDCEEIELLVPFTLLPSVRILRGDNLYIDPLIEAPWERSASVVTEIDFQSSAIPLEVLFNFLKEVPALEKFTYSNNDLLDVEFMNGTISIIESLVRNAGHSLQYLSLAEALPEQREKSGFAPIHGFEGTSCHNVHVVRYGCKDRKHNR